MLSKNETLKTTFGKYRMFPSQQAAVFLREVKSKSLSLSLSLSLMSMFS